MTYVISISGSESLQGDEKTAFEQDVIDKSRAFVGSLTGIISATVSTNTQGSTNLVEAPQ